MKGRNAFPFKVVPDVVLAEQRIAHNLKELLVQWMIGKMDGLRSKLVPAEGAEILQSLENGEAAVEPPAKFHELLHLAEIAQLVGEGHFELSDLASRAKAAQKLHVPHEHVP